MMGRFRYGGSYFGRADFRLDKFAYVYCIIVVQNIRHINWMSICVQSHFYPSGSEINYFIFYFRFYWPELDPDLLELTLIHVSGKNKRKCFIISLSEWFAL